MLLVLVPLAVVLLSVGKLIGSLTLSFAFDVLTFVVVSVGIDGLSLSVGLPAEHFSLVFAAAGEGVVAYLYLLSQEAACREY